MTAILLSPHHLPDDETLFAAFTIMRERPKVIVVLESHLQEQRGNTLDSCLITNEMRRAETRAALRELYGGDYEAGYDALAAEFWLFRDDDPDWDAVERRIGEEVIAPGVQIYAPSIHADGHEHHNMLAAAVARAVNQTTALAPKWYCSYERGTPDRRVEGHEVVPEPWMVVRKLRALACYRSQIHLWPHHFLAEQREFYA